MATIRQVRRSIFLIFWFLLSAVRAWPSRLAGGRVSGLRVEPAIMLHLPSFARDFGYGLELGLRPARARLVKLPRSPITASLSPGAFVSRMPRMQQAAPQTGAFIVRTTGPTRTTTPGTTPPTSCTTAPPPVPPPTTTVGPPTTTPPPAPGCTRTTINTVCARINVTSNCAVRACCWSQDQSLGCVTISQYTVKNTSPTTPHTTFTTFTTGTTGFCSFGRVCY